MEEQRIWSREDTGIAEFLVDTEKLRSFKLFSNTIKNGGYYMETSFFQQFFFGMGKLITW